MTPPGSRPAVDWVDPFDLPEWLGTDRVQWAAEDSSWSGCLVRGALRGPGSAGADDTDDAGIACDLFAVDEAYPAPVADEVIRRLVHQSWCHGQVLLGRVDDRLRLLTPGRGYDSAAVLETVGRLAKAVGAAPERFSVVLQAR